VTGPARASTRAGVSTGLPGAVAREKQQEDCIVRKAIAAIIVMAGIVMAGLASSAYADCASGVVPERLSCLNIELETQKAQAAKDIASLKAEIQMLRNQLLGLRQIVDGLPPPASIARLDEDVNVLWEPQDGCLAWTGSPSNGPAPTPDGSMQVFAPCAKAPSPDSVLWRLRRAPPPR
jgi:hypothetical protein